MKNLPLWILIALLGLVLLAQALRGPHAADPDIPGDMLARNPGTRFPIVRTGPGFPLELDLPAGGTLLLAEAPRRVLPTNAGQVDFLRVLIGAERVAAIPEVADRYSGLVRGDAGPAWEALERLGAYRGEVVLALDPDLVLTNPWQSPETSAVLTEAGIPVLVTPLPHSWADVLVTLRLFGDVLGVPNRAADAESALEERRLELAGAPHHGTGLRVLAYTNFGSGGSAAGAGTTVDVVLALCGFVNAASEAGLDGHAEIDHERLLALDPDVLVVAAGEEGGFPPSARHLTETAALEGLAAVREERIVVLSSELFSTTSIELMTAAEELSDEVSRLLEDG